MDPRLPDDRQECPIGGTIGLADTPYAAWAILRELDGTYTLFHEGESVQAGFATVSAALDAVDAVTPPATPAPDGF